MGRPRSRGRRYDLDATWRQALATWMHAERGRGIGLARALGVQRSAISQLLTTTNSTDLCEEIERITEGSVPVPGSPARTAQEARVLAALRDLRELSPAMADAHEQQLLMMAAEFLRRRG
jgi:hypothetical protein